MPFTGSHPAAVLPFIYLGLPPSALVIGSMVPDLPYFLPLLHDRAATHSTVGLFTVDPVLGIACLALWGALVGPLALAVAPTSIRRRIPQRSPWRPRQLRPDDAVTAAVLLVSLVLGSATHVLWDEFTHDGRFGTRHLPWLAAQHGLLPGYEWAQYASGLVGGALLVVALSGWWRQAAPAELSPNPAPILRRSAVVLVWTAVLGAAFVAATIGFLSVIGEDGLHRALFAAVTWGGGGGLIVVSIAALACASTIAADRTSGRRQDHRPA